MDGNHTIPKNPSYFSPKLENLVSKHLKLSLLSNKCKVVPMLLSLNSMMTLSIHLSATPQQHPFTKCHRVKIWFFSDFKSNPKDNSNLEEKVSSSIL